MSEGGASECGGPRRTRCATTIERSLPAVALAAGVGAGAALRFAFFPSGPEGWDAVDFILALDSYDLSRYQPHFPGYPLYVLAAKLFHLAGLDAEAACRAVGALAGALLPIPLWFLLERGDRDRQTPRPAAALLAAFAAALAPGFLLESVRIGSDTFGFLLVLWAAVLCERDRPRSAGLLAGLVLGVRAGALPLVLGILARVMLREWRRFAPRGTTRGASAGLVAGVLLWWMPQVGVAGAAYFKEALDFVRGHFIEWGGSAITGPPALERLGLLAEKLWIGWGGWASGASHLRAPISILLAAGLGLFLLHRGWRRAPWLVYLGIPQLLTVLFLQNPEHGRHLLPLHVLGALSALLGLLELRRGILCCLALGCLWLADGCALLDELSRATPPALAAVESALARVLPEEEWVFCGESFRLFQYRDPARRVVVRRARSLAGVEEALNATLSPPRRVAVFSDVEGYPADGAAADFRGSRFLFDLERMEIHLYEVAGREGGGSIRLEPLRDPEVLRRWR